MSRRPKKLAAFSLLLAACASGPRSGFTDRAFLEDRTAEAVREAAQDVVEELVRPRSRVQPRSPVRVYPGRLVTEGHIGRCGEHADCGTGTVFEGGSGPAWTTLEIRWSERGEGRRGVELDVDIEYRAVHECYREGVECVPERFGSTGVLEREIVDRVRARLEEKSDVSAVAGSGD